MEIMEDNGLGKLLSSTQRLGFVMGASHLKGRIIQVVQGYLEKEMIDSNLLTVRDVFILFLNEITDYDADKEFDELEKNGNKASPTETINE